MTTTMWIQIDEMVHCCACCVHHTSQQHTHDANLRQGVMRNGAAQPNEDSWVLNLNQHFLSGIPNSFKKEAEICATAGCFNQVDVTPIPSLASVVGAFGLPQDVTEISSKLNSKDQNTGEEDPDD
jgi:hypothetical protein